MSLGESLIRVGARDKVLGKTRFGFDLGNPGDLHLIAVRAKQAPARILRIDPSVALTLPGVTRVFTASDIPGENRLGIVPVTRDHEFLAQEVVRQQGQAVALVAAKTREQSIAGARAIRVDLEPLSGVFDPAEALREGAPLVHPDNATGNLIAQRSIIKGDAAAALKDSAVVIEATYTTGHIEHCALEMEGGRAYYRDGRVIVHACTQNPHYDRNDIARFLGVEEEMVRVIQAETGGGFGTKLDLSLQPFLALAAWHLKQPVTMRYTREESFLITSKRHPFIMHFISGADEQGRLTGLKARILSDTGAFSGYGLAVNTRAAIHACGPYFVPYLDVSSKMAYTNNPYSSAMRGFGVVQVAAAHEGQMTALANALGMNPIEFRLINALRHGQATGTGQVLHSGVGMVECLKRLVPIHNEWTKRLRQNGDTLEGVGVAAMFYGIGNTQSSNPSTAQVEWEMDGRITLSTGAADIGQGSDTVLRQLAATRLGIEPEAIDLCRGDTDRNTNAGNTSASRQTYISGNAVLAAVDNLQMQLVHAAREIWGAPHLNAELDHGQVLANDGSDRSLEVVEIVHHIQKKGKRAKGEGRFDPDFTQLDPQTGQGQPYSAYAFAAQCAKVKVDAASGMTQVLEVAAAHDVGRAVNPRAVIGQICGGVTMGLGMALMEEFRPGYSKNLHNYHIPTIADAPRVTSLIVEEPVESGPFGAKGVGEPALIPTVPAVALAVGNALGRPMRHLPISLERVMEALTESKEVRPEDGD